jgi:hypothetical protein
VISDRGRKENTNENVDEQLEQLLRLIQVNFLVQKMLREAREENEN